MSRAVPKKASRVKCALCGKAIPRFARLCSSCDAKRRLEERRLRYQQARIHRTVVFESSIHLPKPDTCGELIELFRALLMSWPEYVRPTDVPFLLAQLADLEAFPNPIERWGSEPKLFRDLESARLEHGLHEWVSSSLRSNNPLLSTYRLALCEFMEAHLAGHYFYDPPGRILPLFDREQWSDSKLRFLNEASFKRELTMNVLNGLVVSYEAPASVELRARVGGGRVPPSRGLFRVERCHMSQGQSGDFYDVEVFDPQAIEFDLLEAFTFYGRFATSNDVLTSPEWWNGRTFRALAAGMLPVRWITHASSVRGYEHDRWPEPDVQMPRTWLC